MTLTSRKIEKIKKKPFIEPRFTNFFVSLIRLLTKIPIIRSYLSNSSGGLFGRICFYWEEKNYEKASHTAIYALEKFRNKKSKFLPFMDHHTWWEFMMHGAESASPEISSEYTDRSPLIL
jgi:hypothetical protein